MEAATFALLLAIVVMGNDGAWRAGVGFVHGCIYLLSLFVAWRSAADSRTQGLAVVPGVGALLLARQLIRRARRG